MDVRLVDPRDTAWEIDSPSYRVYFWERTLIPAHVPARHAMYRSAEFELSGVEDVRDVLEWAETTAPPGATYTVYAAVEHGGGRGLLRLAGVDPTAG